MRTKFINNDAEIIHARDLSNSAMENLGTFKSLQQHAHTTLLLAILDEQRESNDMQKEILATFRQIADELTLMREARLQLRGKEPLRGPVKKPSPT